ncbi:MAG: DUF1501 domain-containing protein [Akkermansiaceae bacterium]
MKKLTDLNRRDFLATTARTCFGVTLGGSMAQLFNTPAFAADPTTIAKGGGKAKHVIYLYMSGGMTHLDTFDPKPQAEAAIHGGKKAINTKADGIQLSEYLPNLARHADKLSIIRSMSTTQGAHGPGRYFMRTGYTERSSITHPSAGGWVNKLTTPLNDTIPGFVTISCGNGHPGAGFMEPSLQPLPIGDPLSGLQDATIPKNVTESEFHQQLNIRQELDHDFDEKFSTGHKDVRAYTEMYNAAVKLMRSEDLEAFDLSKETSTVHKLYGSSKFAKGCLLARRLVEKGVRFVEVELGGFDWHNDNFGQADEKLPIVDQAFAALLEDLQVKGLLDSTLIVLATEFGRSPKLTGEGGRNHFPKAFSCIMAGGGTKGGYVHGETDATGSTVTKGKVSAPDFNASIGHALGIPYDQIIYSASKRPFKMASREGKPILDLFG